MAIDIKVIPTLRGEEAARFVKRGEEVMNNNNRVDFSAKYNPQNEMLPFHKTKCSETQNEASSL